MISTKLAKKVLTKKEQDHLTTGGINSMRLMQIQVDFMTKADPESPGSVCWDCWVIARKLKLIAE